MLVPSGDADVPLESLDLAQLETLLDTWRRRNRELHQRYEGSQDATMLFLRSALDTFPGRNEDIAKLCGEIGDEMHARWMRDRKPIEAVEARIRELSGETDEPLFDA